MAKRGRTAAKSAKKSAKKSARKTTARVAKKGTLRGATAKTSLVQTALGISPKYSQLPGDLHEQLTKLFEGRTTPSFLKFCSTSMAGKFLIVKVTSLP